MNLTRGPNGSFGIFNFLCNAKCQMVNETYRFVSCIMMFDQHNHDSSSNRKLKYMSSIRQIDTHDVWHTLNMKRLNDL